MGTEGVLEASGTLYTPRSEAAEFEVGQHMMPGASGASSPADDSFGAAQVPTPPTQHDLKKAVPVALLLMKPASTLTQATVLKAQDPQWKAEASPPHESGSRENQNLVLHAR